MLKCESRASLQTVQYKWQPASAMMFCSYCYKNSYRLSSYVLQESKPGFVPSLFLFFAKIKAFVLIKMYLLKKEYITFILIL